MAVIARVRELRVLQVRINILFIFPVSNEKQLGEVSAQDTNVESKCCQTSLEEE